MLLISSASMMKNLVAQEWSSFLAINTRQIWINGVLQNQSSSSNSTDFTNSTKGSGIVSKRIIEVPDTINDISISGIGLLQVQFGNEASLTVEADDNIHPHLTQSISGSSLDLNIRGNIQTISPILYALTLKNPVSKVKAQGATEVTIDPCQSSDVALQASGSSSIHIKKLIADKLSVHTSGASSIKIERGNILEQTIECSGASNYHASKLQSEKSFVTLSDASNAIIHCIQAIKGRLSGVSQLNIRSNPQQINLHTSGAASCKVLHK